MKEKILTKRITKYTSMVCFVAASMLLSLNCSGFENPEEKAELEGIEELSIQTRSIDTVIVSLTNLEYTALRVDRKGTYEISESEANDRLENFASSVTSDRSTTHNKSVSLKNNRKTGKGMYYEIVFEGDKGDGFAIVSADERVPEVLCYTEIGAISDTTFNQNMKFCLELIDMYMENQTSEELDIEPLLLSANEKLEIAKPENDISDEEEQTVSTRSDPTILIDYHTWEEVIVSERLKATKSIWHQNSPFNDLMPSGSSCGHVPAGCVTIAVGQIIAYHEKPFGNYIMPNDWEATFNDSLPYASSVIRPFIKDIFDAVITSYSCSSSSGSMEYSQTFFNNNGFTAGIISSYHFNWAWDALYYGPTYIQGFRTAPTGNVGHAWVLDGAKSVTTNRYEQYWYYYIDNVIKPGSFMFHEGPILLVASTTTQHVKYNWGWGNSGQNSWHFSDVYQPNSGPNSQNNYNINVKMISYIIP